MLDIFAIASFSGIILQASATSATMCRDVGCKGAVATSRGRGGCLGKSVYVRYVSQLARCTSFEISVIPSITRAWRVSGILDNRLLLRMQGFDGLGKRGMSTVRRIECRLPIM